MEVASVFLVEVKSGILWVYFHGVNLTNESDVSCITIPPVPSLPLAAGRLQSSLSLCQRWQSHPYQ